MSDDSRVELVNGAGHRFAEQSAVEFCGLPITGPEALLHLDVGSHGVPRERWFDYGRELLNQVVRRQRTRHVAVGDEPLAEAAVDATCRPAIRSTYAMPSGLI